MALIGTLIDFEPGVTARSADVDQNFNDIRTAFNNTAVLTDVARVIDMAVTPTSGAARAWTLSPTLTASANDNELTALRIAPTFGVGAFTGVKQRALEVVNGESRFGGPVVLGSTLTASDGTFATGTGATGVVLRGGGNIGVDLLQVQDVNSTPFLRVSPVGNVGVGIAPSTALHVSRTDAAEPAAHSNTDWTSTIASFGWGSNSRLTVASATDGFTYLTAQGAGYGLKLGTGNSNYALTINDAGAASFNRLVGIGTTPGTAWAAGWNVLQPSPRASLSGNATGLLLMNNAYYNGTNYLYIEAAPAAQIQTGNAGTWEFNVAPSGGVGSAVNWTKALQIANSATMYWHAQGSEATYLHGTARYFQLGTNTMLMVPSSTANEGIGTHYSRNAYYGGDTNWYRWRTDHGSSDYLQHNGGHLFRAAAAATGTITWMDVLRLSVDGFVNTRSINPMSDNAFQLGQSNLRWTAVWAVNGTIQTSTGAAKDLGDPVTTDEALATIRATPIRRFTYREDPGYEVEVKRGRKKVKERRKHRHVGVVLEDLPEWLQTTDTGLNPMSLAGLAVAGVKGVDAEVGTLRNRVAELERRIAAMTN